MLLVRKLVGRYRRSPVIRGLARLCHKYLDYYECHSYSFIKNGERNVLHKLRTLGLTCIFDVGAHKGEWLLMAREIFPNARIHAFEIIPELCQDLLRNCEGRGAEVINPFGLSDTNGATTIHYNPDSTWSSSLMGQPPGRSWVAKTVQVMTGDSYMEKYGIDHIDFLKIDVEGAEARVLKGFKSALLNKKIEIIQFKYNEYAIVSRFLLIDFYNLLVRHGYKIGKIYYDYVDIRDYHWSHERFVGPNYLAVRGDRADLLDLLS